MKARVSSKGMRFQLFITMSMLLAAVLLATTLVTLWVTRSYAYEDSRLLAREQLEQFSRRAVFLVLVGANDRKLVDDSLSEVTEFRDVLAVEVLDAEGRRIGVGGTEPSTLSECAFKQGMGAFHLIEVGRPRILWCGTAPVRESILRTDGTHEYSGAIRGAVRIVSSPRNVGRMIRELTMWNVVACLLVLGAGILLAWREVDRLTEPLRNFSDVIAQLRTGRSEVRASLEGPEELVSIARAFNDLMERRAEDAARLESRVQERTRDLRAATDQARRAERSKSLLWAMLSHEMRTPLHVMLSHVHNILSELELLEGSHEAEEDAAILLKEIEELLRRVNQILDLARAEAGQLKIEEETFSLKIFAVDLHERGTRLAKENDNKLTVESDDVLVLADRDKLLQIASNLLNNACQFTRNGDVHLRCQMEVEMLQIVVSDNGPGIPLSDQTEIWQEFRQVESPGGRRAGGFGLGLALVERYTKVLGGSVALESSEGNGTVVTVKLPVRVAHDEKSGGVV